MKLNVDLTEGSDFSKLTLEALFHETSKIRLFPNWIERCLSKPNKILRDCGIRTLSCHTEFPLSDKCERCGRLKSPWEDLCKRCKGDICTPNTKGLPRNPRMESDLRVLRI